MSRFAWPGSLPRPAGRCNMTIQLVGMTARPNPARRERILHEAEQLFFARGLKGVSMDEVAAAAGVKKANLFHYYPSKEALEVAVLDRFGASLRERVAGAVRRGRARPHRGRRPHVRGGREGHAAPPVPGRLLRGQPGPGGERRPRERAHARRQAAALLGGGGGGPAGARPRVGLLPARPPGGPLRRGHPVALRGSAALLQGEPSARAPSTARGRWRSSTCRAFAPRRERGEERSTGRRSSGPDLAYRT